MEQISKTKFNILINMFNILKSDQNYCEVIMTQNANNFDYNTLKNKIIFCFEYKDINIRKNRSKKLKIGWIDEDNKNHITIINKINLYLTKKVLDNFEERYKSHIENESIEKRLIDKYCKSANENIDWNTKRKITYIYVDVQDNIISDINYDEYKIYSDIKLGYRDIKEGYKNIIFKDSEEHYYFDPDNIFNDDKFDFEENTNYSYHYKNKMNGETIEFVNYFEDEEQKSKIQNIFFRHTHTKIKKSFEFEYTKVSRYGLYKEHNAIIVRDMWKVGEKYLYIGFIFDNTTCAGRCVQMQYFVYDTLEELWNDSKDYIKKNLIEKNYYNVTGESLVNPLNFGSDMSDSSAEDY